MLKYERNNDILENAIQEAMLEEEDISNNDTDTNEYLTVNMHSLIQKDQFNRKTMILDMILDKMSHIRQKLIGQEPKYQKMNILNLCSHLI